MDAAAKRLRPAAGDVPEAGILRVTHRSQRGYQYPEFRIGGQYLADILGVSKGDFIRWRRINGGKMLLERCELGEVPQAQRKRRRPRRPPRPDPPARRVAKVPGRKKGLAKG